VLSQQQLQQQLYIHSRPSPLFSHLYQPTGTGTTAEHRWLMGK
jgi:hypothetical protein